MKKTLRLAAYPLIVIILGMMAPASRVSGQTLPYQAGSEISISALEEIEEAEPDVAWNGNHFMVVWQTEKMGSLDIYGSRMTGEGNILDREGIPLITEKGDQTSPRLSWGGGIYLVVWQDVRDDKVSHIYGARITGEGKVLDPGGFPISVVPQKEGSVSVYWDGKQFWVVWERVFSYVQSVIYGVRITPEGEILDTPEIRISPVEGQHYYASISGNGEDQVFVVWGEKKESQTDILGIRLNREGKILDPKGIVIASGPEDQFYPSLSWNGKEYLVVWVEDQKDPNEEPTEHEGPLIYGRRISGEGKALAPARLLSFLSVAHSRPFVFTQGEDFLVLWEEERKKTLIDAYGVRLKPSDPTPQRIEISAYFGRQLTPRAAYTGEKSLAVWMDYRFGIPFHGNILGQLLAFPPTKEKETGEEKFGPFIIHQIAVHPKNPNVIFAATSHYGILKSTDGGWTWAHTNQGLQSFTHTQIAFHPKNPEILYVGGWGNGVSRSRDGGKTWEEINRGLGNTVINALTPDPDHPESLYAATSSGVYRSSNGGERWEPWSEGLLPGDDEEYTALALFPGGERVVLGSSKGVYRRGEGEGAWIKVGKDFSHPITFLSVDSQGTLYAGTLQEGFWRSRDQGETWEPVVPSTHPLSHSWITGIVCNPRDPKWMYAATTDGIWKTGDGGRNWSRLRQEFPTDKDIRSLTLDPSDPARLFAGSFEGNIFSSVDQGSTWRWAMDIPRLTNKEVLEFLPSLKQPEDAEPPLPVPAAFGKCNGCHGWTDPWLDLRPEKTFWRMSFNERDWGPTVRRMSRMADLTTEEETQVLQFLNNYSRIRFHTGDSSWHDPKRFLTGRICGSCHGLKVAGECLAGDCTDSLRLKDVRQMPWPLMVSWMQELGARMSKAEEREVVAYLEALSPAKPSPLTWEKATTFLDGAWNIVALAEWKGFLYAGMEGNGKIYRSRDGEGWEEVANTGANRVYGLIPFHGSLYAGTSDPLPEIWSSPDGKEWKKSARFPSEEKGIISFGIYGSHLYAGTEIGRVYRSSDGTDWEKVAALQETAEIDWVRFLIPFKGVLYAGTEHAGIFRSHDGFQWEPVGNFLIKDGDSSIRGVGIFKDALYVGSMTRGEIWRTEDGTHWTLALDATPGNDGGYVAAMSLFMDALYASISGRIYRTLDGERWEEVGYLGPYTIEALTPFKGQLYAGTLLIAMTRLYRTALDMPELRKEESLLVRQMLLYPGSPAGDPDRLYAVTFNQGILTSRDRGKTWTSINLGIKTSLLTQMAIHPVTPEVLYAASWGGGIYKSENSGDSWKEINQGLGNTAVWGIVSDPASPDVLYAGTSTGIYRSVNGGDRWSSFDKGLDWGDQEVEGGSFLFLSPERYSPLLLMGTNLGGYLADSSKGVWERIETLNGKWITALTDEPAHRILLAGTAGEGVMRSEDGGRTWISLAEPEMNALYIEGIVPDPLSPGVIYLATRQGIRRSDESGKTWTTLGKGIQGEWVTSLTIVQGSSPEDPSILYAGTQYQGIWQSVPGKDEWKQVLDISLPSPEAPEPTRLAGTTRQSPLAPPAPPASFAKCNECHGWTDPLLHQRDATPWRIVPNQREWGAAVRRMTHRAQLTPGEAEEILQYLNVNYGINRNP